MYPYVLFLGMTLYDILLCVGVIVCLILFRVFADKLKMPAKMQNLILTSAIVGILIGYGGAVLMQSVYHYLETGVFELSGATFYGGLIFGALSFLVVYFVGGHIVYKKTDFPELELRKFFRMSDIAACSITAAHGFGRLGCLMAGCCYGIEFPESHWYTATFRIIHSDGSETLRYALPTQLYEAIVLFLICVYLSYRIFKGKSFNLSIYMMVYGVWRFGVEYIRADERGQTVVSFMSPSQLVAVLMIVGGIVLIFVEKKMLAKYPDLLIFEGNEGELSIATDDDSDDDSDNEGDNEEEIITNDRCDEDSTDNEKQ